MAKVIINAGCGPPGRDRLPSFFSDWRHLRVDIDPDVDPDIIADITDLSMIESGAADALWTAHCVEHLYAHMVPAAMAEIRRVLSDDGFACIVVPDMQRVAALIAEDRMHETLYVSPAGPVTPHDMVFGFGPAIAGGHQTMAHRCGFTPAVMTRCLVEAGFGGYAVLRRTNYELAALVRKRDWARPSDRDALIAALAL